MAEGIKISEMEQVYELEDSCCFPVVSYGANKKITKEDLFGTIPSDISTLKGKVESLRGQVTSNDSDIASLQSQINAISKPNNIQIYRMGINESTKNWVSCWQFRQNSDGSIYTVYGKAKELNIPNTSVIINNCLINSYALESDPTWAKEDGSAFTQPIIVVTTEVTTCKGYFEYMY